MHCHISWHQSQGLALQFVERERESEIAATINDPDTFSSTCNAWSSFMKLGSILKMILVYELAENRYLESLFS